MTDPFVVLSNGETVHLYTVLPDNSVGDVKRVTYTLVLPTGTTVVQQVSTDGALGAVEHFHYFATNPDRTYDTTTVVETATMGNPVWATTMIEATNSSVSGEVYEPLENHLYLPSRL